MQTIKCDSLYDSNKSNTYLKCFKNFKNSFLCALCCNKNTQNVINVNFNLLTKYETQN